MRPCEAGCNIPEQAYLQKCTPLICLRSITGPDEVPVFKAVRIYNEDDLRHGVCLQECLCSGSIWIHGGGEEVIIDIIRALLWKAIEGVIYQHNLF